MTVFTLCYMILHMKGAGQIMVERRNEETLKSAIRARSGSTRPRDSRSGCLVSAKRWVIRKSSGSKSDLIRLNPTSAFFYFFGRAIRTGWKSGRRPALRYCAPGRPGALQDASRDSMRGAGQGQSRSVKVNQGIYRWEEFPGTNDPIQFSNADRYRTGSRLRNTRPFCKSY